MPGAARNQCAGPFGAAYDFYVERPRLMGAYGRVVWGIDASVIYLALDAVSDAPDGSTILDVPCGGGVALPPRLGDLRDWLSDSGVEEVEISPEAGLASFRGRRSGAR